TLHLENGDVSCRIGTDQFGIVIRRIAVELHLNARSLFDYVTVRKDVAGLIDNHTGSQTEALAGTAALRWRAEGTAEETLEEILHPVFIFLFLGLRASAISCLSRRFLHIGAGNVDD